MNWRIVGYYFTMMFAFAIASVGLYFSSKWVGTITDKEIYILIGIIVLVIPFIAGRLGREKAEKKRSP